MICTQSQIQRVLHGLKVQYRVIVALMLREIHTIHGNTRLGYLWEFEKMSVNVLVIWAMREFMGTTPPHGIDIAVFLILGFGLFMTVSQSITKCMTAVSANKALLTFPQVTELDVMVARVIVLFTTEVILSIILLCIAGMVHKPITIYDYGDLYLCLFFIALYALGLGTLFASVVVLVPLLQSIMSYVVRIGFFASGVFFSVSTFSDDIAKIMLLNPICQIIEYSRHAFHRSYPVEGCSWTYIFVVGIIILALGLLLERYVRPRRDR